MATIRTFEDFDIWKLARKLETLVFKQTNEGLFSKDYGLRNQINNSSGSIMDNIAEGFGRSSRLEFINFLTISAGSANELKSQLYRALDRGYITQPIFDELYKLADLIYGKIHALIAYLNKSVENGLKFRNRIINKKSETKQPTVNNQPSTNSNL